MPVYLAPFSQHVAIDIAYVVKHDAFPCMMIKRTNRSEPGRSESLNRERRRSYRPEPTQFHHDAATLFSPSPNPKPPYHLRVSEEIPTDFRHEEANVRTQYRTQEEKVLKGMGQKKKERDEAPCP
jgi:hypothetical protein